MGWMQNLVLLLITKLDHKDAIKFYGHALWRNKIYEPPRMGRKIFEATIARGIYGTGR
jgi:hypothetical protein